MKSVRYLVVACLAFLFFSCNENVVYTAYDDIPDGLWYIKNKPQFKVDIKDTTQAYHIYYLLRNSLQYPYYNLYLTREITGPDGKQLSSVLQEVFISNEITGKPFGNGLGDLFDHKIPVLKNHVFPKPGIYTFTLSQSMRQNPLPFVLSVGISVEKVQPVK
ncbi:hypothetical protein DYBT9275_05113 [Dyadobacter sp. CECT 9275]|uniref:Gliding motility lipoprotein GldH n=1 Tax=Dyadobacter helix TaxID=2822344 RepID=A0A916N718_9BACT|nr:gliding motility lipoprotein GldH [Dyadobacter sp. CECT 9275]CAG5012133.1 hypothetical protein DYBT9275_05113 [Dyadobacter sp. CECT 9275]